MGKGSGIMTETLFKTENTIRKHDILFRDCSQTNGELAVRNDRSRGKLADEDIALMKTSAVSQTQENRSSKQKSKHNRRKFK